MRSITYVITDRVGIHARPAGIVVKTAQKYQSEILVYKGEKQADAKKLMQLMSLGVKGGGTSFHSAVKVTFSVTV